MQTKKKKRTIFFLGSLECYIAFVDRIHIPSQDTIMGYIRVYNQQDLLEPLNIPLSHLIILVLVGE